MLDGRPQNGSTWTTGLLTLIFQHLHLRWKHRSDIAHQPSLDAPSSQEITINNKIRDIYRRRHDLPSSRHQSFTTPLQDLLSRPLAAKTKWVSIHDKHTKLLATQHLNHRITTIFTYQHRIPPCHHHLFQPPLHKLIKRRPKQKREWLTTNEQQILSLLPVSHPSSPSSPSDRNISPTDTRSHHPRNSQQTPTTYSQISNFLRNIRSSAYNSARKFLRRESNTTE